MDEVGRGDEPVRRTPCSREDFMMVLQNVDFFLLRASYHSIMTDTRWVAVIWTDCYVKSNLNGIKCGGVVEASVVFWDGCIWMLIDRTQNIAIIMIICGLIIETVVCIWLLITQINLSKLVIIMVIFGLIVLCKLYVFDCWLRWCSSHHYLSMWTDNYVKIFLWYWWQQIGLSTVGLHFMDCSICLVQQYFVWLSQGIPKSSYVSLFSLLFSKVLLG